MNQLWLSVLPAVAAGVFGIAGTLAGRRQTTDEAAVEHGQWLRGQRQTAYLDALDAMDVALLDFAVLKKEWIHLFENSLTGGQGEEGFQEHIVDRLDGIWRAVDKPLERARLLGPIDVDEALQVASAAYEGMLRYVAGQLAETVQDREWTRWEDVHNEAWEARARVMVVCQKELQEQPRPGRRAGHGFWRRPAR
ncbi:hypothetical protein ABT255_50160 [Streptomyces mirabilis]|uniref:hypothetical protein n=1 Tax=Streptomyces mirabilis TaxID=68239 RepID=UPI003318FF39